MADKQEIALEVICALYERLIDQSLEATKTQGGVPVPWLVDIELRHPNAPVRPLRVRLGGRWRTWVGKSEAFLLNGTYSITDGRFAGSTSTPIVDTWGVDPGPGWTPCDGPTQSPANTCYFFIRGKTKETLVDVLGPQAIQVVQS